MTYWYLLVIGVILGVTILATLHSLRMSVSKLEKSVFIVIRLLLGIILIIAFLEPVITVNRLPHRMRSIPVLIDASQSMSLFSPDSIL